LFVYYGGFVLLEVVILLVDVVTVLAFVLVGSDMTARRLRAVPPR
jgi:hypothetical protein